MAAAMAPIVGAVISMVPVNSLRFRQCPDYSSFGQKGARPCRGAQAISGTAEEQTSGWGRRTLDCKKAF
jgi:hypothetical protein